MCKISTHFFKSGFKNSNFLIKDRLTSILPLEGTWLAVDLAERGKKICYLLFLNDRRAGTF